MGRMLRGRGAVVVSFAVVVSMMVVASDAASADPPSGSVTFSYTGSTQTWTVPAGVNSVQVEAYGASGGGPTGYGGLGGRITAVLPVTAGEVLTMVVGGQGFVQSGGYNGGAAFENSGAGGGASDIRRGGTALANRIIVAGGGGGGAQKATPVHGTGGAGGGLVAGSGGSGDCGAAPGGGGSQTAGGAAGGGHDTTAGSFGVGGHAGDNVGDGGNGGGGWYGGGGGTACAGAGGGGGGGSSYTISAASDVVHTMGFRRGNGQVRISYPPGPSAPVDPTPGSVLFGYTGGPQWWTVPEGVTAVQVDLAGAEGIPAGHAGRGGRARAVLPVTAGETLLIDVGQRGQLDEVYAFNGGGPGADVYGGGGATDVRRQGITLQQRVVVAGGGGGAGEFTSPTAGGGGAGGAPNGGPGNVGRCGAAGGGGGTQTAGGSAGGGNASGGGFGIGGRGADYVGDGGGGGGGWYGGGGGANCSGSTGAGGGGGSSYAIPSASGVQFDASWRQGDGEARLSWPPQATPVAPPASPGSATFEFSGSQQFWTVPDGVGAVRIVADGAQGGGSGGLGGRVDAIVPVTAGETLQISVGGTTSSNAGGYGGGGPGDGGDSKGGGGATDVRRGGATLADRVLAAGGGGGSGETQGTSSPGAGGAGGGFVGTPGGSGACGAAGGSGGTQTSGGTRGSSPSAGIGATNGAFTYGGAGGDYVGDGGGGGAGYYGGGGGGQCGGASGAGGGGGSSWASPSRVVDATTTSGVRAGNGHVTISWPVDLGVERSFGADSYGEFVHGVHLGSGNFVEQTTDASIETSGPDLALTRTYNSLDSVAGIFGRGWSSSFEARAVATPDSVVTIVYGDGRREAHVPDGAGGYVVPRSYASVLTTIPGGGWVLRHKDDSTQTFNSAGRLIGIADAYGRTLTLGYVNDQLTSVSDPASGRSLSLTYANGRVTSVATNAVSGPGYSGPLVWNYGYTGDLLTRVCDARNPDLVSGFCWVYGYTNDRLTAVMRPDGTPAQTLHYRLSDNKVDWSENGEGDRVEFTYGDFVAQVEDGRGYRSTYFFDPLYRTTQIVDPALGSLRYEYDGAGFRSRVIDPLGNVESMTYDTRGNLTASTNGEGETRWMSYDGSDNLLWQSDGRSANQADTTYRSTFTYNAAGDRLSQASPATAEHPAGVTQTWAYTAGGEDFGWGPVPAGLLRSSNPGRGADTLFEYDAEGDLRRRVDPSGLITSFAHDALGRVLSTTTTWDGGQTATTQTAYDQLSKVVSVLEPPVVNTAASAPVTHRRETVHVYDANGDLESTTVRDVDPGSQTPGSRPFAFTGAPESFVVPDDVTSITVDMAGGEGGDGVPVSGGQGGRGGRLQATLAVTPGETLQVRVGASGGSTTAGSQPGGAGGYDGGAAGGSGGSSASSGGGGGGGSSDIRRSGGGDVDRVLVAGGGGGGANNSSFVGGAGGAEWDTQLTAASPATPGANGTGFSNGSGGGGGGWRGGNGGVGGGNPGGGGTSMAHSTQTSAVSTLGYQAGNGYATFTWVAIHAPDPAKDRTTTFAYDNAGRLTSTTDPEGGTTARTYDANGNVATVTDPEGRIYRTAYDELNRPVTLTLEDFVDDPVSPGTPRDVMLRRTVYDAAGRTVAEFEPGPGTGGRQGQLDPASTPMRQTVTVYDRADRVLYQTLLGYRNRTGVTPPARDVQLALYGYDDAGNRVTETTGNGLRTVTNSYDQAGRRQTATLELGAVDQVTDFDYDEVGNPTRKTVTEGTSVIETRYGYDDANRLTATTVENGAEDLVSTVGYDQRNLPTTTVDPRGNADGANPADFATTTTHDAVGRVTSVASPPVSIEAVAGTPATGRPTTSYGYDNFGNRDTVIDPRGNRTTSTYDRLDRVVRIDHPAYIPPTGPALTPFEAFTFDHVGNLIARQDRRGQVTEFTFDARNRAVRQLDPLLAGQPGRGAVNHHYDDAGNRTRTVDQTGSTALAGYDDLGRLRTSTQLVTQPVAAEHTTTTDYDDLGNPVYRSDPTGITTTATFDAASRQTTAVDALGNTTTFGHDAAGRTTSIQDPLARITEHIYDPAGRETSTISRDGPGGPVLAATYQGYDPAGNLIVSRSARSTSASDATFQTTYTYDALNRLTSVTEPDATAPIITTAGYDAAGNMTRLTDGRGNTTTYTWSPWNQRATTTEPAVAGQPVGWTTTYDAGGLPVGETQPGPVTVSRTFDNLGRLTGITGTGSGVTSATQTFGYDLAGRRTTIGSPTGTVTHTYDDRGLLLESSAPGSTAPAAAFGYDSAGRMTSRSDAAGTSTFSYTPRGELDHVNDPLTGGVTDYDWDDAGQPVTVRYGSPTPAVRTLEYDRRGRLDLDTLTPSAGPPVITDYGYDPDSNLTTQNITATGNPGAGSNTYTYDRSGRLDTWTTPTAAVIDYGYDAAGNRTQAGPATFGYDERNRLTTSASPAGTTTNTWSARGTLATSTLLPLQFNVGLVVGNPANLDAADIAIRDRLAAAGHTVTLVDDSAPAVSGVALVVIAETVDENVVGTKYRNQPGGVLNLDPALWDDDGLATTPGIALGNARNTVITPAHPAVAGKTGNVNTTGAGNHAGVDDLALGPGATQLLDREGLPSVNVEFAYNIGANRANGTGAAPGRRVALGWSEVAILNLTPDGAAIFDATVRWAGGAAVFTTSTFDALGRQTSTGASTYSYDDLDRVTSRDPDGTGPTAPEPFTYAGAEIDPVAYNGQQYARTPGGELAATHVAGNDRYALANRHGDLTTLLDPTGTVTNTRTWDPYGEPTGTTGTGAPALGYQSDWTDPTTAQVWMGARWYHPDTATFTSRDTVYGQLQTPMSLNRYTYANGDPLEYFDPDGNSADAAERWNSRTNAQINDLRTMGNKTRDRRHKTAQREARQARERSARSRALDARRATASRVKVSNTVDSHARFRSIESREFEQWRDDALRPYYTWYFDRFGEGKSDMRLGDNPCVEYASNDLAVDTACDLARNTIRDGGSIQAAYKTYDTALRTWSMNFGQMYDAAFLAIGVMRYEEMSPSSSRAIRQVAAREGAEAAWDDLARYRRQEAMARSGTTAGAGYTTTRLDIAGESYYGRNAHGTDITMYLNAHSKPHAEAHSFQQALNEGVSAPSATLYIDNVSTGRSGATPGICAACGANGGIGSMMRSTGVQYLTVVTPNGSYIVDSSMRPSVPIPLPR